MSGFAVCQSCLENLSTDEQELETGYCEDCYLDRLRETRDYDYDPNN